MKASLLMTNEFSFFTIFSLFFAWRFSILLIPFWIYFEKSSHNHFYSENFKFFFLKLLINQIEKWVVRILCLRTFFLNEITFKTQSLEIISGTWFSCDTFKPLQFWLKPLFFVTFHPHNVWSLLLKSDLCSSNLSLKFCLMIRFFCMPEQSDAYAVPNSNAWLYFFFHVLTTNASKNFAYKKAQLDI